MEAVSGVQLLSSSGEQRVRVEQINNQNSRNDLSGNIYRSGAFL
jgi:hypothetical protein